MLVARLRAPARERDELVAHVDERHLPAAAAQLEPEDRLPERERLIDVVDLERDVVHPHEPRHDFSVDRGHGLRELRAVERCRSGRWWADHSTNPT